VVKPAQDGAVLVLVCRFFCRNEAQKAQNNFRFVPFVLSCGNSAAVLVLVY
jgi:hypothetical protein